MKLGAKGPSLETARQVEQLVRTLRETERQLQELAGGQSRALISRGGAPHLLQEAQEKLRHSEAALRQLTETQQAILDALPAHIALLDSQGVIVSVNQAWRRFAVSNALQGSDFCIGQNYVALCESIQGGSGDARHVAAGLRAVLSGATREFSLEYSCHSPEANRWFRIVATPLHLELPGGAVVMHVETTEAKRAEQDATLLRIAGRAAQLGGWTIELPERKLTWSDQTCVLHDLPPGYQPTLEEGISMFPPESRAEIVRRVDACAKSGIPYDFELPKITAQGRRIWVRCVGEAVRDAEGKIIRLQGAFQDVTARKRAELELSRSHRALQMLSACSDALIHVSDEAQLLSEICRVAVETGGYRMAWVGYAQNDARCTIRPMAHAGAELGYLSRTQRTWSGSDPTGRGPAGRAIRTGHWAVCADVAADATCAQLREQALERGYRSFVCLPLRNENLTFGLLGLYSAETAHPEVDELKLLQELADNLAFGIDNLRTRAQRRKAEQEAAQKAALLDKATDAIFVCDSRHRIVFWSMSAQRIYGWKSDEAVGRANRDFLCAEASAFDAAARKLAEDGEWTGELRAKTKAGRIITLDCRWTLVRDQPDLPASVLCIETDITEKKKLEAHFLRAQRIESIGTLAGGIAHDLNNVLAPIVIAVQMLRQDARDEKTGQVLNTLETCANRAMNLVKQVLSFARGVEGERILINPARLIRELREVVRDVFPKNIDLEFHTPDEVWTVTGDPTQLHQVFLNLCVNARDAMPGGGRLVVSLEDTRLDESSAALNPDVRPGAYVLVTVTDSGTGISPAIRDRIFEPFFTTKEPGKGTGLGLSTALGIVKSHGGFIRIASNSGKGSEFKVFLPANASTQPAPAGVSEKHRLPRGNGEWILLVDDEQGIRVLGQKILERFGYRVLLAENGAQALEAYTRHRSDISVVVTDMSMPVMDGAALIRALKAVDSRVRIITSSGLSSPAGISRAAGLNDLPFVPKPYSAETLLQILHQELAR